MVDSGPLLVAREFGALRQRLVEDGYLFLRGALPRSNVLRARSFCCNTFVRLEASSMRQEQVMDSCSNVVDTAACQKWKGKTI